MTRWRAGCHVLHRLIAVDSWKPRSAVTESDRLPKGVKWRRDRKYNDRGREQEW